jgi:hypothetical protein
MAGQGMDGDQPSVPDYAGACVCNVVPALLDPSAEPPSWLPPAAVEADRVVLLVLDGLGWHQLQERRHLAPTLAGMEGGAIQTVLPTTTSTALTSISTGAPPGEHGIIGYRIAIEGEVLNVLKWATRHGDARETIPPQKLQTQAAFLGQRPPAITRAEFATSGFSGAHLDGTRFRPWRMPSTLVTEIGGLTRTGEPFVYAYYDGIDKVSHEYGLRQHYDAELVAADRLVADILEVVPRGTAVVVTADHGQVHTGTDVQHLHGDVIQHVSFQSGEARFRWLHARPGRADALLEAAVAHHADAGWIRSRDQLVADGWFGPTVTPDALARLGDVALVAKGTTAFLEPTDTGPYHLVGRHGSATPAELDVPLLVSST